MTCSCQVSKFTAFLKAAIRDAVDCENCGAAYSDLSPVYAIYFSGRCIVLNDMHHARAGKGGCVSFMKGCTQDLFLEAIAALDEEYIDGLIHTVEDASLDVLDGLHEYLEDVYLDYHELDTLEDVLVKQFTISLLEDVPREQIEALTQRVETRANSFPCELKMLPVSDTDCKSCLTLRRDMLRQYLTKSKEALTQLQQQIRDVEKRIAEDTAEISKLEALF
jgi:hypothetical protein